MNHHLEARPYTAWQLLRVYWQSEQKLLAYGLLGAVLLLSVILVGFDVVFTTWYNHFYNALQDYDGGSAFDLIIIFLFLAAINIVVAVYRYYLQSYLALRWRRWLTTQFINRWLQKKGYYYLEDFGQQTDNPDQRLQEDIGSLVTYSLNLFIGLLTAVVTIFSFIYILWVLSNPINLSLGKYGSVHIPGYLVWVALLYSAIGTYLTYRIGRPLVNLNFEQQRREANFRFAAIDLRSHVEHIALYRGEEREKTILQKTFSSVLENWYAIILRQKTLLWFTNGYNQISLILPSLLVLPNYFSKAIKLGGLMQTASAFRSIQEALSFIVNAYTTLAEWQAIMRRLLTFLDHLSKAEFDAAAKNQFVFSNEPLNQIAVKNVNVQTPQNKPLLKNINQQFVQGKHYWIKGNSGIGKSTFVRAIANIWPYGKGEFSLPTAGRILFIPQRSYMPLGTLKEGLLFPDHLGEVSDDELIELLKACDLSNLIENLHQTLPWADVLSPGELQRIAFIRILLQKPDWVFLDESTSSLDLTREEQLYQLVKTRLPRCSLISVGHRPSLEAYHDYQIDFSRYSVERG